MDNIKKTGVWNSSPIEQIGNVKILKNNIAVNQNLVTTLIKGGQTTIDDNYSLHSSGTNADTYFYAQLSTALQPGDIVTVSCDVSGFTSDTQKWNFPFWSQTSGKSFYLSNGYCKQTFTVDSSVSASSKIIFDDNGTSGFTRGDVIIKITNFKIEYGSIATPFIPSTVSDLFTYKNPVEAEFFYEI